MDSQLFQIKFNVNVGGMDYPVVLDALGEGDTYQDRRLDAARQIKELVCSKHSRDSQDENDLFAQAARQFRKQFVSALDDGNITLIGSREVS